MQATHAQLDIRALQASWQAFDAMVHLRPVHSEMEYDRMVELMNSLLEVAGDDEDHPLSSLLELAGTWSLDTNKSTTPLKLQVLGMHCVF